MIGSNSNVDESHLNANAQSSIEQPSIFDILSQDSLTISLKPAIRHLIKYLSSICPQRFDTASKWYDELYTVFELVTSGASFSENFYGIKRIALSTGSIPSRGFARLRSLIIIVIWPYIKDKLDQLHDQVSLYFRVLPANYANTSSKLKAAQYFHRIYPWLKLLMSGVTYMLQLAYILSTSPIHSPLLYMAGVRLEKLSTNDIAQFDYIPAHLRQHGLLNRLWRYILALPGIFSRLFAYSLLFVEFIDFFYNTDFGIQQRSSTIKKYSNKIPAAPHKRVNERAVMLLESDKCPICLRPRQNDTVLNVSGYVFCYECISEYVSRERKCPVTSLPAKIDNLIRIFHDIHG
ncbi:unnamed protein product [Anisakis simplex]|uniref:Peroxisome assembly protein 12 n=1 Tax=Anisakis simplex TaxID=6269 RepID=A0A0M3JY21_ANISI|nr:unnamed protein product [Anisakis simplex]